MDYNKEKYKKIANAKLKEKPFGVGMYAFVMFLINYYSRIKKELRLDYDSFMIIQVVVSHSLYNINKETFIKKMSDLGVPIRPFFYPLSQLPPFSKGLENNKNINSVSYDVSNRGVNLPGSARMKDDDLKYVCDKIKECLS